MISIVFLYSRRKCDGCPEGQTLSMNLVINLNDGESDCEGNNMVTMVTICPVVTPVNPPSSPIQIVTVTLMDPRPRLVTFTLGSVIVDLMYMVSSVTNAR